jgi:ComF family protein
MPLNKVLHALKYNGQKKYAATLGYLLSKSMDNPTDYDLIIPIPLHPHKFKERGFNQVDIMLNYWQKYLLNINNNIVIRVKDTIPQALSNLKSREQNIANAFQLKANVTGMKILVVDDVITTSSTVNELSRILKEGGATTVDVCALMRAI